MMGQKTYITYSKEDHEKEKEGNDVVEIKVEYLDETKEIAGYKCHKAIVTTILQLGNELVTNVFYTKELPPQESDNTGMGFEKLDGLMLEMEMNRGPIAEQPYMVMTAIEVEEKTLDNNLFEVPDDYKQVTTDELNKSKY